MTLSYKHRETEACGGPLVKTTLLIVADQVPHILASTQTGLAKSLLLLSVFPPTLSLPLWMGPVSVVSV